MAEDGMRFKYLRSFTSEDAYLKLLRRTIAAVMYPPHFLRLTSITVVYVFAIYLTLPILAPYFAAHGYSAQWISFAFGIFSSTMVFSSLLVGNLGETIGRERVAWFALITQAVAYGLYLFGWPSSILAGRVLDAVSFSAVSILLLASIEDVLQEENRGRYTGLLFTAEYIARLFAPLIGGVLADRYLGLPLIASIGMFLALAVLLRSKADEHSRHAPVFHPLDTILWFLRHRQLRPMAILGMATGWTMAAIVVFLPLLIVQKLGLSYTEVGLAMMVYGAGHLLQYFFGGLVDHAGKRQMMISALIFYGTMLIVLSTIDTYLQLLIALAIMGVSTAAWNVSGWCYLASIAAKDKREDVVIGTYISIQKIGDSMSFFLAGVIVGAAGYGGVFAAAGAVVLFSVLTASILFISRN